LSVPIIKYRDMEKTTKQNSPIKVGDYVKWNDPAIHEYDECDREDMLNRVFEVFAINGDVYSLSNEFSEVEALEHELVKVDAPYFIDIDCYSEEDRLFVGLPWWENEFEDYSYDTKEEGIKAIRREVSCGGGEMEGYDICKFSVIRGVYGFHIDEWICPLKNRSERVVYETIVGDIEKAKAFGLVADEYIPITR
jgi:hypothetical protein